MRRLGTAVLTLALLAAGCSGSAGTAATTTTVGPTTLPPTTTSASTSTTTTPAASTSSSTTTTIPVDVPRLARAVLMVGLAGSGIDEISAAHLTAGGLGVLLLGDDIGTAAQVRSLTREASCAAAGPLLIAVDQELGAVARLRGLVTALPSTGEALEMTPEELEITGQLLGDEMLALGINVDFAPVLDVVAGPNPALEGRHLGADPEVVAELGLAFWRGLELAGVIAVPKHFPGHGRAAADPHDQVARVGASLADLQAVDFVPFSAAVAAGARAIMVGHPVYAALDPGLPASISPVVLALLRDDFGFEGVAITDALNMAGVAAGRDPGDLAVAALAAGEDLLLVIDPAQVEPTVAAIVAAVATGRLALDRLQEAAARVRALADAAAPIACNA
ncbi:MAG: beta-N-acetylhexosaminidase [Acidimicrobiia bacterium]|nr:beta-N-acetylhexosaminidase [Acidimicrobiia bacterium]